MRCPKCQFDHELQTSECLKCGIIFSRYQAAVAAQHAALAAPQPILSSLALEPAQKDSVSGAARVDALRELRCRIFAFPLALLAAWSIAHTPLAFVAGMLTMVLHESGHAITSWLTGRWAVPLLWVTMHGDTRSWGIVLFLAGLVIFVGFLAWKAERWVWVLAAGLALLVQLIFLSLPAESAIVFGGDGGAMVLATLLMAVFYAPRESAIQKSWVRWGLLAIGALSFLHVYLLWTGPYENIPFGEIEGVNLSDPSLLTEMYGWSVMQLVDRYARLGMICLVALLAVYIWGLVSAYQQFRRTEPAAK